MSEAIVTDAQLQLARSLFAGGELPPLSYGTVRDYCQFADVLPRLASYSLDLKDHQRCWMLKTIMTHVPVGSRLLEIGAGEPIVADILGRLGYHVTVVDPYEGAGNGPTTAEQFKQAYPRLEYIMDLFTSELAGVEKGSLDCCYSISVLEHIGLELLPGVVKAMYLFSKPGARLFHAVDCVTGGLHADYHGQIVKTLASALEGSDVGVDAVMNASRDDPETYYLSAEGHNRWRGTMSYDEFPMRRCISFQLASRAPAG